jgi:Na+-transporting NADH:ubiquinone oxidoreductase subunit C
MIRQRKFFPVLYMFLVTAGFSSVVIGFTALTQERVQANARLALESAVLSVLPGVEREELARLPGPTVHQRFTEQVAGPEASSGGAYIVRENGQIAAYALPFEGQGFWARIRGIIGIAPDKKTVTGIAFYEQSETPGLGAEITKPAFRNQFKGKTLAPEEKPITMRRPGTPLEDSDVHAVTGATQTSVRVEAMINRAIQTWRSAVGAADHGEEPSSETGGAP